MTFITKIKPWHRILFLVLWLLLSIWLTYNLYVKYSSISPSSPNLEFRDVVAFFTACIVSGTLIFHVINIELNNYSNEKKLKLDQEKLDFDRLKLTHEKKVLASSLIGEWGRKDIVEHATIAKKFADDVKNKDEIAYNAAYNSLVVADRDSIVTILNFLERVSTGIVNNYVDEQIIKEYYEGIFKYYLTHFGLFIEIRRRAIPYPDFCDSFHKICKNWKS